MKNFSPDKLLNDAEINVLADLFLHFLNADRASRDYRLLRNAVILYSHGAWTVDKVYALVGECAELSASDVKRRIGLLLDGSSAPACESFNRTYAPPDIPYDTRRLKVNMSDRADTDYIVSFLGYTFLYLVLTNYDKYDHIDV